MPLVLTRRLQPMRGLVDLAPVVTVVLLLLCFFLLSSSFVLQPGIKVDLPHTTFSDGTPSSRLVVVVSLAPQEFDDAGKPLPRVPVLYFNDQIVTLDGLSAALDQIPKSRIPPSLVVKADEGVPLAAVTQIINVAHHFPIFIATQPVTGTAP